MDQLLVARMLEFVSTATTSLVSLVELLDKVKNMVISDVIQQEVTPPSILSSSKLEPSIALQVESSLSHLHEVSLSEMTVQPYTCAPQHAVLQAGWER